jgi:hypothetical protein
MVQIDPDDTLSMHEIRTVDLLMSGSDRMLFHYNGDLTETVQFDQTAGNSLYPFGAARLLKSPSS